MNSDLPATGTAALIELLDPFVLDDFINECWPQGRTGGRHHEHTSAQLFRVHLLCLLTPVHSLTLLVKMLPEQRAWRKFAGLRRQSRVPDVRMMHQFRGRVLLGQLPLANRLAQRVLQKARPWIEPAQSHEKNQPGLSDMFFNSLRFTWVMALLADAVVLLRARAMLGRPAPPQLLAGLMPFQLSLELEAEDAPPFLPKQITQAKRNSSKTPMNSAFHTLAFVTPSFTP